jgi:hypothetical protein
MQSRVQRGGLLLQMIWARCAGKSGVGDSRAGTSSIGGVGISNIVKEVNVVISSICADEFSVV